MILQPNEQEILCKVLRSSAFQALIGAEEWNLTEQEEEILWDIIEIATYSTHHNKGL